MPISSQELEAFKERAKHTRDQPPPRKEPPEVEKVSKQIAKLVYDPLASFVDTLIVTYGQYWLEGLQPFDSRECSIVKYVENRLGAYDWSEDGTTWDRYPGGVTTLCVTARNYVSYRQFLKREDWSELADLASQGFKPSLGARLLSRAVQLFGLGHTSEAFVHQSSHACPPRPSRVIEFRAHTPMVTGQPA